MPKPASPKPSGSLDVSLESRVPALRVRRANELPVRAERDYVLYWMTSARRRRCNFALQRAVDWARALGKSLLVFEALRCDYHWASDRLHAFVLQGMQANQQAFADSGVGYFPYVEPCVGAGKGLLAALAARAAVLVGDEFPCFMLPKMVAAGVAQVDCAAELVDANGLLPLRATDKAFARAFDFRRYLQRELPKHFAEAPYVDAVARAGLQPFPGVAKDIVKRWPAATEAELRGAKLAELPIDHGVGVVSGVTGGSAAAKACLDGFVAARVRHYEDRNQPDVAATSGLSPYLHFGHIGTHEILAAVARAHDWRPAQVSDKVTGQSTGWWGLPVPVEGFLDQIVTWRELGYNFCHHRADYDQYESLPDWTRATLEQHARDPRPHLYDLSELATAQTHDPLWNAGQTQLVREGTMHNYLRMLWAKKILEWSPHPRVALEALIELNNRYALDGRNPNSYTGIFWCLGRYDRPWAPERPIFGLIRYMSSDSAMRKIKPRAYIERYSTGGT
jgi:deoxyribodipyrimidine photo-lyase